MTAPAMLLTVLLVAFVASRGGEVEAAAVRSALPYLIGVNHTLLFAGLLLVLRSEKRGLRSIGWTWDRPGGSVVVGLLLSAAAAVALYAFKEVVLDSVQALVAGRRPTFTSFFRFGLGGPDVPLLGVATTLVAVEESIYRGYGLAALERHWGRGRALLVMALLFGVLHWGNGPLAILFTGTLGLGFGGLFLWRRSLMVPIVAHALYNALVILT